MSGKIVLSKRTEWDFTRNELSDLIEVYKKNQIPFIDLSVSNPTNCRFSFYTEKLLSPLGAEINLVYQPESMGILSARKAVADYYAELGNKVPLENIVLTSSTSEAYSYIFKLLLNSNDQVLFPRPSYPLFQFLGDVNDAEMIGYDLLYDNGWKIDFESVEAAITDRSKAILLVNPNNPTGSYVSSEEIVKLNDLCTKYGLSIISDEVFNDFSLNSNEVTSLIGQNKVPTFVLSGISKVLALPQMKLSWIIINSSSEYIELMRNRIEMIADTFLSVSAPVQNALGNWFKQRNEIQTQIKVRMENNLKIINSLSEASMMEVLDCQGGWSAVLKFRSIYENFTFELLKNHKVYVHPGYFYDFDDENYCVLSLLTPPEDLEKGIKIIKNVLK